MSRLIYVFLLLIVCALPLEAQNIYQGGNGSGVTLAVHLFKGIDIYGGDSGSGDATIIYDQPFGIQIFQGGTKAGYSSSTVELDELFDLPVELTFFEADVIDKAVELQWQTASELNNKEFDILRSADKKRWETIAKIEGAGNSNVAIDYSWVDSEPYWGTSYYRLIQNDLDGATSYSYILEVKLILDDKDDVLVFPNPFVDEVSINLNRNEQDYLKVYSLSGTHVPYEVMESLDHMIKIKLTDDSKGIFLINALGRKTKLYKQ
ncbi:hypothetical protein [Flammeovirga agarivorans]|uniref:Secretion system C-terminal sorting domain-containing protein n=1 Tax=Flammeovirga agarivorans TaxID=2726742 RepID=A0A7X8XXW5_9BACT|nr:hypothetical protein [Flammeovirga agarivorans]NLR93632.1 hypothetical protein [Flammeovirga agarivorans]